jgi:hypothetical protein
MKVYISFEVLMALRLGEMCDLTHYIAIPSGHILVLTLIYIFR